MTTACTHKELWRAYRKAGLRRRGITFLKVLNDPLLYKSLCLQAEAMRKTEQQHGTPAPTLQAA